MVDNYSTMVAYYPYLTEIFFDLMPPPSFHETDQRLLDYNPPESYNSHYKSPGV
jgi:hypothetical protein